MALTIILVILLATAAIFLSKLLLGDGNKLPALIHSFIGLIILSTAYLWKERLGMSIWIIYLIVSAIVILYVVTQKKSISKIDWLQDSYKNINIWSLLFAPAVLPTIIQSCYMTGNLYPAAFYNVDVAFAMQFVHDFIQTDKYPPDLLSSNIPSFNYHYGAMAAASLISEFTHIPAHISFLFILPCLTVLVFCNLALEIMKGEGFSGRKIYISTALFLFGYMQYIKPTLRSSISSLFGNERFYAKFLQIPSAVGANLILLAILCSQKLDNRGSRILSLVILAIIPLFKIPFTIIVCMGVGLHNLHYCIKNSDNRHLARLVLSGVLLLSNYFLFIKNPGMDSGLSFAILGNYNAFQLFSISLFTAFFITLCLFRKKIRFAQAPNYLLYYIIPFFIFTSVVSFNNKDGSQLIDYFPMLVWLFIIIIFIKEKDFILKMRQKYIAYGIVTLLTVPSFLLSSLFVVKIALNKTKGHEYCSNEALAPILMQVPLKNTIIATNDTRYPSGDSSRIYKQFQFSGIFGHRCINTEMGYSRWYYTPEGFADRIEFIDLLSQKNWDGNRVNELCTKYKVTHLVIHKNFGHPEHIPLPLVIENTSYALYQVK
jgi:hypothetical protein